MKPFQLFIVIIIILISSACTGITPTEKTPVVPIIVSALTPTPQRAVAISTATLQPSPIPEPTPITLSLVDGEIYPQTAEGINPGNVSEVVEIARPISGPITHIAVTVDETIIAAATTSNINVYDIHEVMSPNESTQLKLLCSIDTGSPSAFLSISADNIELRGAVGGKVLFWSLPDCIPLRSLEIPYILAAITSDGTTVASYNPYLTTKYINLWSTSSSDTGKGFQSLELPSDLTNVLDMEISSDGRVLAVLGFSAITIWDLHTFELSRTIRFNNSKLPQSLAVSPDGQTIGVLFDQGGPSLYKVSDGNLIKDMEGKYLFGLTFSADGEKVAGFTYGGVILYPLAGDYDINKLYGNYVGIVRAAAILKQGELIVTGSGSGLNFSTFPNNHILTSTTVYDTNTATLAMAAGAGWFVYNSLQNGFVIRSASTGAVLKTIQHRNTRYVLQLAASSNGRYLASFEHDNTIHLNLWDVQSSQILKSLPIQRAISYITFSPDEKILAAVTEEQKIELWSIPDGTLLRSIAVNGAWSQVAFSPDGQLLAIGEDLSVRLIRVADGGPVLTITGTKGSSSLAFSPDGKFLAAGSLQTNPQFASYGAYDTTIRIWSLPDGDLVQTLDGHLQDMILIAYSPDGALLVSIARDNSLRLWDPTSGSLLMTFDAPVASTSVYFSPDGHTIIGAGRQDSIRVWGIVRRH